VFSLRVFNTSLQHTASTLVGCNLKALFCHLFQNILQKKIHYQIIMKPKYDLVSGNILIAE
jgi:adenine C2-methylase RlmN of 23S rRNA A2503 and tRNA A37